MTNEEIKAEAARRFACLTEQQKREMLRFSKSNMELLDYARANGTSSLTPGQKRKLNNLGMYLIARTIPGDIDEAAMENQMQEENNVSREEIKETKNPFKMKIVRDAALFVLLTGGAIGFAAARIALPAIALLGGAVFFAYDLLHQAKEAKTYGKLQKKLVSGKKDEEYIEAEMQGLLMNEILKDINSHDPDYNEADYEDDE